MKDKDDTKGSLLMRKVEKDPEGELSELSEALVICESIRITAELPSKAPLSVILLLVDQVLVFCYY